MRYDTKEELIALGFLILLYAAGAALLTAIIVGVGSCTYRLVSPQKATTECPEGK